MARGINKVIIVGNLGQDPELRYTGSGTAVCNLRIATNESYKDANGQLVDKVEWHSIVAWGRLAEICGEYLKKGSQAYFEGSLQSRSYEDKDGNMRYVTEVKAREMMLLGGRSGGDGDFGSAPQPESQSRPQARPQGKPQAKPQAAASGTDDYTFEPDDELPF